MNAPLLAMRNVVKRYGRRTVLHGASFEVHRNEIVGIVGENGAGKSTLLRILVGLLRADTGHVQCTGRLGYCDQEPQLFPELTVAEHFAYFACAYGIAGDHDWLTVRDQLLGTFRYARDMHVRTAQLSGGTRQKLHLSLALLHRPDVVVLDEPFLAFDWDTYLRFWTHAEALRAAGTAIVMVSHLVHDRARFTRILDLRDGELRCA